MRKLHTPMQSISTLKWSKFYKIPAYWNLLYCVPYEESHWYAETLEILQKITHFNSPTPFRIAIYNNAPYYNEKLVEGIMPFDWMNTIFPDYIDLYKIGKEFAYLQHKYVANSRYVEPVLNFIYDWCNASDLSLRQDGSKIIDNRLGHDYVIELSTPQQSLLRYLDVPRKIENICEDLKFLLDANLVFEFNQTYTSLVDPLDDAMIFEKLNIIPALY